MPRATVRRFMKGLRGSRDHAALLNNAQNASTQAKTHEVMATILYELRLNTRNLPARSVLKDSGVGFAVPHPQHYRPNTSFRCPFGRRYDRSCQDCGPERPPEMKRSVTSLEQNERRKADPQREVVRCGGGWAMEGRPVPSPAKDS